MAAGSPALTSPRRIRSFSKRGASDLIFHQVIVELASLVRGKGADTPLAKEIMQVLLRFLFRFLLRLLLALRSRLHYGFLGGTSLLRWLVHP